MSWAVVPGREEESVDERSVRRAVDDVSLGVSGGRKLPDNAEFTKVIKYATTRLADLPKGQAYGT